VDDAMLFFKSRRIPVRKCGTILHQT
jgi:hypothetical protein